MKLVTDGLYWIPFSGGDDNEEKTWRHMALKFYFPQSKILRIVSLYYCLHCFIKPQQMNIMSWLREELKRQKKRVDLKKVAIPRYFKEASRLVGAAM